MPRHASPPAAAFLCTLCAGRAPLPHTANHTSTAVRLTLSYAPLLRPITRV